MPEIPPTPHPKPKTIQEAHEHFPPHLRLNGAPLSDAPAPGCLSLLLPRFIRAAATCIVSLAPVPWLPPPFASPDAAKSYRACRRLFPYLLRASRPSVKLEAAGPCLPPVRAALRRCLPRPHVDFRHRQVCIHSRLSEIRLASRYVSGLSVLLLQHHLSIQVYPRLD